MFRTIIIAVLFQLPVLQVGGQDTVSINKRAYNDAGTVVAPVNYECALHWDR